MSNIIFKDFVFVPDSPSFFARRTTHVTSTGDIVFDTATSNVGGHYNTSNGRFTLPKDGTYLFTFGTLLYTMNYASNLRLFINGNAYGGMSSFGCYGQFTGSYAGQSCSAVVTGSANDYITLYYSNAGTNLHSNYTWWSGTFLH